MPPHGTWARYCAGCRCEACAAACTEYGRARRAANKAGVPFVIPEHLVAPSTSEPLQEQEDQTPTGESVVRRHSYRVTVPADTAVRLNRVFGACRFVFNGYLDLARTTREAGGKHPSWIDGQRELITEARRREETAWLRDIPQHALQVAVRNGHRAYENFFASVTGRRKGRKVGFPRFKKRTSRQSATFTAGGFSIRGGWQNTARGGGRVWVNKVGYIHVNWHRPLPADPSSVTIIREADGTWRASFTVETPKPASTTPTRQPRAAGIDVGLADYAAVVYSDGTREKIPNPRYLRGAERKLARAQKHLSRTPKGSRNREKARREVARLHARVRHLRENHARQLASRLTRENQAVAVETLNIQGMARTRLAKSIHDAGWGQFITFLEEAAARRGRDFVKVEPGFPSSRVCSLCGTNSGPKALHVREWTCPDCDARLDRDYNAAVNILVAAGSAETRNACGRSIRLRLAGVTAAGEAGTHRNDHAHPGEASRKPRARTHPLAGGDRTRNTTAHVDGGLHGTRRRNHPDHTAAQPQKDG